MFKLFGSKVLFSSAKRIITGDACSKVIVETAVEVGRVASITLGPMGRNVLIENEKHEARITKDGVTVVKHIEYEDRFQDAVCTLIKQSVNSTNKFAGDGTTTSSLMIGALLKESKKLLEAGFTPRQIKEGLKIGRGLGLQFLKMAARPVDTEEEYFKVAMIATKGDEKLSKLIAQAVNRSQLIKVQKTQKNESYVQYYEGVKMVSGITHPEFKNVGDKVQLDYPLVLLDSKGIESIQQVLQLLQLAKKTRKQVLLVSNKISQSVMSTLIYNKMKKIVQVYPVLLHGYSSITKDYFNQLSKATGAVIFDEYKPCPISQVEYSHLGRAVKVQMDQIQTVVYGKSDAPCANAVIYAGGNTEAIALEVYDKIIDALNSVKTAKKFGVVAGGGVTYWRMAQMLEQYTGQGEIGVKILGRALMEPRKALVKHLPNYYMTLRGQGWQGYNFKTGKLQDMFQAGIIDSAGVGQSVLLDSISMAYLLLDIQVAIIRDSRNVENRKQIDQIQQSYQM